MAFIEQQPKLVIGNFNSEEYWRDSNYALLPSYKEPQTDAIISVMDEVQFPFCNNKNDLLITRHPLNEIHANYLRNLGFHFRNNTIPPDIKGGVATDIFELLNQTDNQDYFKNILSDNFTISPFSVIPKAHDFCNRYGINCFLPNADNVAQVNSKHFSHILNTELLGLSHSCEVNSSEEFRTAGENLLSQFSAFLVKDPFGVSGKGNILINSIRVLESIKNYLAKQEKKGKIVSFILESLFDKKMDFSCQFEISENNTCQIVAIHEMENEGFAFSRIKASSDEFKQFLEKANYFNDVHSISNALHMSGYYGPVCLDSMVTTDGKIVQIIEINARKSMGFINHSIDAYLSNYNTHSKLSFLPIGVNKGFTLDAFFNELETAGILFQPSRPYGILPLTTKTITINELTDELFYKGRFYFSLVTTEKYTENNILDKLRLLLNNMDIKVY